MRANDGLVLGPELAPLDHACRVQLERDHSFGQTRLAHVHDLVRSATTARPGDPATTLSRQRALMPLGMSRVRTGPVLGSV